MPVYILIIHARPANDNPKFSEVAGAYVNCFIENETFDLAEQIAIKFLEDEYWIPIELEETYEVTEDNYVGDPEGLEVYKQVLIDKEIYTFHTYVSDSE
jgi:hypothetical protein